MRQNKGKKEKNDLASESMSGDQAEQSHVDNIISDFASKGMDREHRELEDDLENSKKRGREKGNTPEAVKKASHISRLSMAGGQSKLPAPGKVSLLNK